MGNSGPYTFFFFSLNHAHALTEKEKKLFFSPTFFSLFVTLLDAAASISETETKYLVFLP